MIDLENMSYKELANLERSIIKEREKRREKLAYKRSVPIDDILKEPISTLLEKRGVKSEVTRARIYDNYIRKSVFKCCDLVLGNYDLVQRKGQLNKTPHCHGQLISVNPDIYRKMVFEVANAISHYISKGED